MTTASVVSEMTVTLFEPESATNTSPFPESYARAIGSPWTGMDATTVFVASEMTLTLSER